MPPVPLAAEHGGALVHAGVDDVEVVVLVGGRVGLGAVFTNRGEVRGGGCPGGIGTGRRGGGEEGTGLCGEVKKSRPLETNACQ